MSPQFSWPDWERRVLDIIFPPHCLSCRRFGSWVCDDCWQKIGLIATPICYKCNRLSPGWEICANCRRDGKLRRLIVSGYWQNPLKQLVYGLKYHRARPVAERLGKLLSQTVAPWCRDEDLVIVPVPLHRGRLWDRGFNQAELLARVVSQYLDSPLIQPLVRRRWTKPQFGLTKLARRDNISGAFAIKPRQLPLIVGKKVLLIDDLVTTGATINECAKVLKQNGAHEVWGAVLAKA